MALRNKYESRCYVCGEAKKPNSGFLERKRGEWWLHCDSCYRKNKAKKKNIKKLMKKDDLNEW